VVVTVGETLTEPEAPDAEKPVPLQFVALALLHVSVEERPLGIELAEAERIATGAGAVAACATTTLVGTGWKELIWAEAGAVRQSAANAKVESRFIRLPSFVCPRFFFPVPLCHSARNSCLLL
jgi:hypothetical protein